MTHDRGNGAAHAPSYEYDDFPPGDPVTEMQVQIENAEWHRVLDTATRQTVCGQTYELFASLRPRAYRGQICPQCHFPSEIAEAVRLDELAAQREEIEAVRSKERARKFQEKATRRMWRIPPRKDDEE